MVRTFSVGLPELPTPYQTPFKFAEVPLLSWLNPDEKSAIISLLGVAVAVEVTVGVVVRVKVEVFGAEVLVTVGESVLVSVEVTVGELVGVPVHVEVYVGPESVFV